jgi:hypothetical protein
MLEIFARTCAKVQKALDAIARIGKCAHGLNDDRIIGHHPDRLVSEASIKAPSGVRAKKAGV